MARCRRVWVKVHDRVCGHAAAAAHEPVPLAVAKKSSEMMLTGGDVNVVPVTLGDDEPVGNGEVGEVTKRIFQLLSEDATGEGGAGEDHYVLDYGASSAAL